MRIDAILPTFNRANLLTEALDNALAARIPPGVKLRFLVVDNNSNDDTRNVISKYIHSTDREILYFFEPKQGRHHALNLGITQSTAEIVAFFDDDEKITPDWFEIITRAFQDKTIDYIAGPVRPDWSVTQPPPWLPLEGYGGVLGIIDNGMERKRYNSNDFHAMPTGGNFAIRKAILDRCGSYPADVKYHEDLYLYKQLLAIDALGFYLPDMEVSHFIQKKRLQKSYFRHWVYDEGISQGKINCEEASNRRAIFGVPTWRWRQSAQALGILMSWHKNSPDRFKAELDLLQFLGYYVGKNIKFIKAPYVDRS